MKNLLKWLLIIGGVFLVIIVAAVMIIPQFVDIQKYKPVIEQKVAEATGRSFTLGDEIDISVFPWVGVKLTDLHFGNGTGYTKKDMVSVKNFEVRLKVMPLLSKKIEVKTFVLDSPQIFLEKLKSGKANWQGIGKTQKEKSHKEKKKEESSAGRALPIEALLVGNFSIINGQLTYVDHKTGMKKQISDLNLNLNDISLEKPIGIAFNANIDGKPLSLKGTAGPIGKNPGRGTIALDFVLKALGELEIKLKGSLIDPIVSQTIDLEFDVLPFSPRKLFAAIDFDFPVKTKDPKALDMVSFKAHIKGNPSSISLSNAVVGLDDSQLKFSASAKQFSRPDLKFDINLDKIDLDRYIPESPAKESSPEKTKSSAPSKKKTNYEPLRKLVLDGKIKAGKIKAGGATVEDVDIHILAKDGIITIDPLDLNLYQGNIASKLKLNVQKNNPKTKITIDAKGIQAGPLMKDVLEKELLEGTLKADIELAMKGEKSAMIKKTLTGRGELLFTDGAVIGIDLANIVRNIQTKLGGGEELEKKPRTDFAALKIPFTAKKGLINTSGSSLKSPLIRVLVTGKANLVKEMLDFRVEPKFVATLKGQGDTTQRSGLMVPVLITGSFASPKIRPDLEGMIKGDLTKEITDLTKGAGTKEEQKEKVEDIKKQIKSLLPGLLN